MSIKFYKDSFLAKRRQWWLKNIYAVECQLASSPGIWHRGTIQNKYIDAEAPSCLIVKATFNRFYTSAVTYVAIRLIDVDGSVAAVKLMNTASAASENVLLTITLPIYEIQDTTGADYNASLTVTNGTATASEANLDISTLAVFNADLTILTSGADYTAAYADSVLTISGLTEDALGGTASIYVVCKHTS